LYLPRIIVMMENLVQWRLAGENEVLGENLPRRHFVYHKFQLPDPDSNPGRCGGKPVTNRLSYGAARCHDIHNKFHEDGFSYSKVDMGEYTDTQTAR
jgi:hypothetical protein